MKPNSSFSNMSPEFWAITKYVSGQLGYSQRISKIQPEGGLKKYHIDEIYPLIRNFSIAEALLYSVLEYLNYRADFIEGSVQDMLMEKDEAREVFSSLRSEYKPQCHLPMNKQKGRKRHFAYFTGIINILTEANLANKSFDDNPSQLVTITNSHQNLVQTLSRQIDGAYPSTKNPIAIWEIKEYYGTTTFGSRVADAVYETQLDGYELRDMQILAEKKVEHYLFVDDKFTWWVKGKSYLCRLIDILHQQLVDQVIFGREVLKEWPRIVQNWH